MNLKESIDNLYAAFSTYTIEGNLRDRCCNCCVSDEEIKQLLSKPLKEISEDDIYHFMTSATTTFGDVNDYKHFLPRILELMKDSENILDDFLTFEKLNYNNWKKWDIHEIKALINYFETSLINALDRDLESINDFILLNLEYNEFDKLSNILTKSNSKNFIREIIEGEINGYFHKVDDQLLKLYSSKEILTKIENLFFETKDKDLANRISIAYSLLEFRS
ncbi:MAG: hypothetical protein HRT67_02845 [Flavobacteriaceae bacterium]|nr:hypothetical protein [Flavobacteriaceae bacterium]